MGTRKGFQLMIITANRQAMLKHVPHLRQAGYLVELAVQTATAIDMIKTGKSRPRAVLLSWSLQKENIPAIYARIMHELRIPCIVYSEDQSRKANNDLLKSRIPNVIFPPLSGHGIDRRIQQLLRVSGPANYEPLPSAVKVPQPVAESNPEISEVEAQTARDRAQLAEQMNGSVKSAARPSAVAATTKTSRVLMVPVTWGNLEGYLIVGQSAKFEDKDLMIMRRSILESLKKIRNINTSPGDFIDFELAYDDLHTWSKKYAEILTSDGEKTNQLLVAFANLTHLPGISKEVSDEYLWANLDGWITLNTKLPFDIFVHLQTNQKFIRYFRKDVIVSEEMMTKLNKVGTERMFLEPKESPALLKHCIETTLSGKKTS